MVPLTRSDRAIREDIDGKLKELPLERGTRIDATVSDGIVTLTGSLASEQERRAVERAAAGVRGVIEVRNDTRLRPPAPRSDAAILYDVRSRLQTALPLEAPFIEVAVKHGQVRLRGHVATATDFNRADMLSRVTGASGVDSSQLEVDPGMFPTEPRAPAVLPETDEAAAQAIRDALFYDPRVISENVSVRVHVGQATLTGSVHSLLSKQAAADDASHTPGITSVRNLIVIKPMPGSSDQTVAGRARAALQRDSVPDLGALTVQVDHGRIDLSGHVGGELAHQRALEVVSSIPGVRDIDDQIAVGCNAPPAAAAPTNRARHAHHPRTRRRM